MGNHTRTYLEYLDFELLIDFGYGQEYSITLIRSPAGEIAYDVHVRLPFTPNDLENFLDDLPFLLIRSSNQSQPQAAVDEQRVRDFGQQIFDTLFAGDIGRLYRASQIIAETQGKGLRLKLRIRPPELAALPWEFLFDPCRGDYVCLSRYTPLVRYLEVEKTVRPLEVELPLRVLGFAASPRRMFQIDISEERNRLAEALEELAAQNLVELIWWKGQTWHDLQAAMRSGPWNIFHFIGHGSYLVDADEGGIILSDENGQPSRFAASDFARLLVDQPSLRAVILNSCEGARSNTRSAFSSTAAVLVRLGIPAVLAMQYSLSDIAALHFGREVYQALASWLPIDAAVSEARKAVHLAGGGSLEWGNVALYMRTSDGALFAPTRKTGDSTARDHLPYNLPRRQEFFGRDVEKAQVHTALRSRAPIVNIVGIGGIGKTALALEVAHECLSVSSGRYTLGEPVATFAGIVWLTAKDRDLTLNAMLDTIAQTLEDGGLTRLPTAEKQVAIRQFLKELPILLLVDNFETITDKTVRDFLSDLPEPSKALVTSREQLLPEAHILALQGLSESEAIKLIRSEGQRLGSDSLEHARDALLSELYQATGGAPLAMKWAVGQIKQKGQALDRILRALRSAHGEMFDTIFDRSWSLLSSSAQQVLRVMPVFAAPASRAGIQAACGLDDTALDEALAKLIEMSLVETMDELDLTRMRFSIHPLTRTYADMRLRGEPDARRAVLHRLARYYTAFTTEHGGFWNQAGFTQIEMELANILALLQRFWEQSAYQPVAAIFNNIIDFLIIHGYWNDLVALGNTALALALKDEDELNAARVRVKALAWVQRHEGELDAAEANIVSALPVFERQGEWLEFHYAQRNLGRIAEARGELGRAQHLLAESLAFFQSVSDERHTYLTTANLARVALERGDLDTAWSLCERVIEAARRFDDPERIASLLKVMGYVVLRRGERTQAKALWGEGLEHSRRAHRLDEVADAQFRLAQIEIAAGQMPAAKQLLSGALDTYRALGLTSRVREIEQLLTG